MSYLGPEAIHWASGHIGCGVYFNAMVKLRDKDTTRLVKYGVAATDVVERDLLDWNSLYVAGRLHKAVETLIEDQRIASAQEANLSSALRTALFLLGSHGGTNAIFPIHTLMHTIVSLSYTGDIRVGIAEDSNKADRIVDGSGDQLLDMYAPALTREVDRGSIQLVDIGSSGRRGRGGKCDGISRDSHVQITTVDPSGLLESLPAALRRRVHADVCLDASPARHAARAALASALAATVRRSSARQAALGLLSAGPTRAARYMLEKLKKTSFLPASHVIW